MQVWQLQESALADPRRVKEGYACPTGARERIGLFRGKQNHGCGRRSVSDAARHPTCCSLSIPRLHQSLQDLNMKSMVPSPALSPALVHGMLHFFRLKLSIRRCLEEPTWHSFGKAFAESYSRSPHDGVSVRLQQHF